MNRLYRVALASIALLAATLGNSALAQSAVLTPGIALRAPTEIEPESRYPSDRPVYLRDGQMLTPVSHTRRVYYDKNGRAYYLRPVHRSFRHRQHHHHHHHRHFYGERY